MVAYANSDVLVQAWIGAEDKLPRMDPGGIPDRPFKTAPIRSSFRLATRS